MILCDVKSETRFICRTKTSCGRGSLKMYVSQSWLSRVFSFTVLTKMRKMFLRQRYLKKMFGMASLKINEVKVEAIPEKTCQRRPNVFVFRYRDTTLEHLQQLPIFGKIEKHCSNNSLFQLLKLSHAKKILMLRRFPQPAAVPIAAPAPLHFPLASFHLFNFMALVPHLKKFFIISCV